MMSYWSNTGQFIFTLPIIGYLYCMTSFFNRHNKLLQLSIKELIVSHQKYSYLISVLLRTSWNTYRGGSMESISTFRIGKAADLNMA